MSINQSQPRMRLHPIFLQSQNHRKGTSPLIFGPFRACVFAACLTGAREACLHPRIPHWHSVYPKRRASFHIFTPTKTLIVRTMASLLATRSTAPVVYVPVHLSWSARGGFVRMPATPSSSASGPHVKAVAAPRWWRAACCVFLLLTGSPTCRANHDQATREAAASSEQPDIDEFGPFDPVLDTNDILDEVPALDDPSPGLPAVPPVADYNDVPELDDPASEFLALLPVIDYQDSLGAFPALLDPPPALADGLQPPTALPHLALGTSTRVPAACAVASHADDVLLIGFPTDYPPGSLSIGAWNESPAPMDWLQPPVSTGVTFFADVYHHVTGLTLWTDAAFVMPYDAPLGGHRGVGSSLALFQDDTHLREWTATSWSLRRYHVFDWVPPARLHCALLPHTPTNCLEHQAGQLWRCFRAYAGCSSPSDDHLFAWCAARTLLLAGVPLPHAVRIVRALAGALRRADPGAPQHFR